MIIAFRASYFVITFFTKTPTSISKGVFCVVVAPRIDRNAMVALKLRAGQSIEYDIPVAGEPPPSKTWSFKV